MNRNLRCFTTLALVLALSLLAICCGKKSKESSSAARDEVINPPVIADLGAFLEKQEVICNEGDVCPGYLAKIVVVDKDKVKFCTGFLTDNDVVTTSSSCLSEFLRLPSQDCSKDVYLYFPKTANYKAERVGCKSIKLVSKIEKLDINNKEESLLWRDDVAQLEIEPLQKRRTKLAVDQDGFASSKTYQVIAIEQVDEHVAVVRKNECQAMHETYINPLVSNEFSPSMTFVGCTYKKGFTGAPILSKSNGGVRGIVSQPMNEFLRTYIQKEGWLEEGKALKDIFHATNLACAPILHDNDVRDQQECGKTMSIRVVEDARTHMLNRTDLFVDLKKSLEMSLEGISQYIRFKVTTISQNSDEMSVDITPRCFKDVESWIFPIRNENHLTFDIDLPFKKFRKAMNPNGRIVGVEFKAQKTNYRFQFFPKILYKKKASTVYMWNNNANSNRNFPNLSERCPDSLL